MSNTAEKQIKLSQQQNINIMMMNNANRDNNNHTNIPVIEVYWSLVAKADKKFSKIRDLPYYQRNRYDTYFGKVFKVYTHLWKFQQENRQKLVEAGLKRWEIGDIASRIGQLYFGQYMRTSEATYLSESFIFYEAILTREYFKDGMFQDANIACKQLRFLARFLTVCLVLNRRELLYQVVNQLKMLLEDCKKIFLETDFKEWKIVFKEIAKFLKADTSFMNIRPLRYSIALDVNPDSFIKVDKAKRKLRLTDALLCSYHPNEFKFSELTLDNFRMLQCLEWEPSGSFYKISEPSSSGTVNGSVGSTRINYSQDITDLTLPPNPRKAILYRPSVTHFMAVLATVCEELPSDGILLTYISVSGNPTGGLNIGARGNGDSNCIFPCDLVPFTRRPIFLIIDSDISKEFKVISGGEKGEQIAMLLSPNTFIPQPVIDSRQQNESPFTTFLTSPLQAFILLLGLSSFDIQMDVYNQAEMVLSSSLNEWGSLLTKSNDLNTVWAQILTDPFLRRLLLRFIFCRAALALYGPSFNKSEYVPECVPSLPDCVLPSSSTCQELILQLANIFGVTNKFIFSENIIRGNSNIIQ